MVIVEDDAMLAGLQAELLDGHNVEVVTSHFAELFAPERWADVDVAVVDLMLPGVNGEDLLDYLAAHHPQIRRVVSTAMPLYMLGHVLPKADHLLLKPFGEEQLRSAVEAP